MNITTPDKNITGQAAKTNVEDASTIASTIVKDANISSKAVSTSVKDTITHLQDSSSSHRISNFETENDSFAPNVWGPELNKIPKIGKDSSANHGQKEERKGAIALLDNFGHKLFKQSSVFLPRHSGHQLTKVHGNLNLNSCRMRLLSFIFSPFTLTMSNIFTFSLFTYTHLLIYFPNVTNIIFFMLYT